MEVSKLSISQETISRLNRSSHLSNTQKRKIRVQGIDSLIKSNPNKRYSLLEIMSAAGYRHGGKIGGGAYASGSSFLLLLRKRGVLVKHSPKDRLSRYSVFPEKLDNYYNSKNTKVINTTVEDLSKVPTIIDKSKIEEKIEVKHDYVEDSNESESNREFSFEIIIHEKKEHGYKKLSSVGMTEVSKSTMRHLVDEVIDKV